MKKLVILFLFLPCLAQAQTPTDTEPVTNLTSVLAGGFFVLEVDQVASTIETGGEYLPISSQPRVGVWLSQASPDGQDIFVCDDEWMLVGGFEDEIDDERIFRIAHGISTGGVFSVWVEDGALRAELELNGSGVPVIRGQIGTLVPLGESGYWGLELAQTEDNACDDADDSPFQVHGQGTPAGTERLFRTGDVFSAAGSEGGSVSLALNGVDFEGLTIQRTLEPHSWGEEDDTPVVTTELYPATDDGYWVEHQGSNVRVDDVLILQVGSYRIQEVATDCFRVLLLEDIPPYQGE